LPDARTARPLFDFAAVHWPTAESLEGRSDSPEGRSDSPEGRSDSPEGRSESPELAWGAFAQDAAAAGERLVGAVVGERAGGSMMLHGPIVVAEDAPVRREDAPASDALEIAAQLVAAALDHAAALGVETVFTRPQGLDRVWVRFGFIPVPEGALPDRLAGRPGAGLYAWRGGTALWTFREGRSEPAREGSADGAVRASREGRG
jgi:hypothetical protein